MKYNCIIIDDEPIAHEVIENYVLRLDNVQIVKKLYNTTSAKEFLLSNKVDFIFLDIEMPGENGLDFLSSLPKKPITIITTAFREFALEGFDLGVIDYLLKPIKFDRFKLSISRVIEFFELQKSDSNIITDATDKISTEAITIKSGTKYITFPLKDITHIQGLKDYAIIFTTTSKFVVKGYMKMIESIFKEDRFIRVHKSFIVAKDKIKVINRNKIEFGDHQIPIGRVYKSRLHDFLL